MRIVIVPMLRDNYAYLLINDELGMGAIVDPSDADAALEAVQAEGIELVAILNTHHHWDHTGGNQRLLEAFPCLEVIGYGPDRARIPGLNRGVEDGERLEVVGLECRVLFVPCHTQGHVAYLFGTALFSGDTLFAAGCGRFSEGTAAEMHHALYNVFGVLDSGTLIYCGHEYTETNLRFAESLEPTNLDISRKLSQVREQRKSGVSSIPTTLADERTYNPFYRVRSPELVASLRRAGVKLISDDEVSVLSAIRELKNTFS